MKVKGVLRPQPSRVGPDIARFNQVGGRFLSFRQFRWYRERRFVLKWRKRRFTFEKGEDPMAEMQKTYDPSSVE